MSLKNKSIDGIIWNLIERYGIQLVSLFIGIILARLLTPSDYGLIGMIGVFFALSMVFINSGLGGAYIQKKNSNEVDASTIFFFNLFVSSIFYIVLWFSAPFIAAFYEQNELVSLLRASALVLIINSFRLIQIAKLTKEVNFKKKSIIELCSSILSGIIGITSALLNYGVWSLVFQQISGSFFSTLGLWIFYRWRPQFIFSFISLKELFSYSIWLLFANIIQSIFDNIYTLVIGKFFPVAQLGFYNKAKSYRTMVTEQPVAAVGVVSFPIFSKFQLNRDIQKKNVNQFMIHITSLIGFLVAFFIVVANPLFYILLTEKWMQMVPYFQLLLIAGFFYPLQLINLQVLNAQGETKRNFKISIYKNILRVINIYVMYRFGIIYIIFGEIIVSIMALFINGYYTKKLINYGIVEQLKDIIPTIGVTLASLFIGFYCMSLADNNYLRIVIGGFSVIIFYILFNYIFNRTLYIATYNLLKYSLLKRKV